MRRKPPGKLLPGAHAVDREARVMSALGSQGFPVPHVHGLCEDEGVIGTPFFVMDLVDGRIIWEASFPCLSPSDRAAHFDAMNDTIARLHGFDPQAIGLGDYGRATGFIERQVARWSRQYETDIEAGRVPAMDRLVAWLRDNLPEDSGESRVVHGVLAIIFPFLVLIVAGVQAASLLSADRLVDFSSEETVMHEKALPRLGRAQARRLLDQGFWMDGRVGDVLIQEGENAGQLYYLASGTADVRVDDRLVGEIGAGQLVGEATVLGETAAIATVTLTQPSRFWCAQGDALNDYLTANPEARHDKRLIDPP